MVLLLPPRHRDIVFAVDLENLSRGRSIGHLPVQMLLAGRRRWHVAILGVVISDEGGSRRLWRPSSWLVDSMELLLQLVNFGLLRLQLRLQLLTARSRSATAASSLLLIASSERGIVLGLELWKCWSWTVGPLGLDPWTLDVGRRGWTAA